MSAALRENSLFEKIDWENIHNTSAPFIPNPDDDTDTSYFIGTNICCFSQFINKAVIDSSKTVVVVVVAVIDSKLCPVITANAPGVQFVAIVCNDKVKQCCAVWGIR